MLKAMHRGLLVHNQEDSHLLNMYNSVRGEGIRAASSMTLQLEVEIPFKFSQKEMSITLSEFLFTPVCYLFHCVVNGGLEICL